MKQINTKKYAIEFCEMVEELMHQFKCVGNWNWGDPAGQSEGIPTYELVTKEGEKVWCATIEYVHAGTGIPNRRGILATFPADSKKSLGSVMATMVPYEYKRNFNTRAYCENDFYEIRNYGKVTVGRAGIKREDFFRYMNENFQNLVLLDEEDRSYIKVYEYTGKMTKEEFAKQTYEITKLLADFKKMYR